MPAEIALIFPTVLMRQRLDDVARRVDRLWEIVLEAVKPEPEFLPAEVAPPQAAPACFWP